ncbi:hypothetical protein BB559_000130 [Furculomyces boomerangus]|uniref:AP-2 complex subunit alpha n=1 Tax=Furculomyces boomerangus TaxID=61424 RepID=A0A2T9Z650_9FUNG|nr:hypothetical protein BB559_000130 [Furculomyces boomerangus]
MSMRGLNTFISELRKCKTDEEELKRINKELANIRSNFKDKNLNGYNRKKYVSKLIFMTLAGYDIDFGHQQIVDLITSPKYSEKRIGYLGFSVILSNEPNQDKAVVNGVLSDLGKSSEINSCLALHAIPLLDSENVAHMVSESIYNYILTQSTHFYLKKKAALCLAMLARKYPNIIISRLWCEQIIDYISYPHLGVAISIASLVLVLIQQKPEWCDSAIEISITKLEKFNIENECPDEYSYYRTAAPWLQIKLLKMLQYFDPPTDDEVVSRIQSIVKNILQTCITIKGTVQSHNIRHALAIEAINLAIHLERSDSLNSQCVNILSSFITSRDSNIRYIGLDTIAHLAVSFQNLGVFQSYRNIFFSALKSRDLSIQLRVLDLLFTICNVENAKEIVKNLMLLFPIAKSELKDELATKIALLTERYATEYTWYVDVMFNLITIAGDNMDDNVWHQVVNVILKNEELHIYGVRLALTNLHEENIHKNATKTYLYLLGELGHLVALEPSCEPENQLSTVLGTIGNSDSSVRGIAATTIAKMIPMFPEIKQSCIKALHKIGDIFDNELQQRVSEYIAIAELDDLDLMKAVFEQVPPTQESQSVLVDKLLRKKSKLGDRRTWIAGKRFIDENSINNRMTVNLSDKASPEPGLLRRNTLLNGTKTTVNSKASFSFAPNSNYEYLLWNTSGPLYKDSEISVEISYNAHPPNISVVTSVTNISSEMITEFEIFIKPQKTNGAEQVPTDKLSDGLEEIFGEDYDPVLYSNLTLLPNLAVKRSFELRCSKYFEIPPSFVLKYNSANQTVKTIDIPLPISFIHFIEPVELSKDDFFTRWKQLVGPPYELQTVFAPRINIWKKYKSKIFISNGNSPIGSYPVSPVLSDNGTSSSQINQNGSGYFTKNLEGSNNQSENNLLGTNSPFADQSIDVQNPPNSKNPVGISTEGTGNVNGSLVSLDSDPLVNLTKYVSHVFERLGFCEVSGADSDGLNFVGVGIATTGDSGRFYESAILLCGICALSATIFSLISIFIHIKNYTMPGLQKWVVRILLMVPVYAICSWLSMIYQNMSHLFDAIRDVYEYINVIIFACCDVFFNGNRPGSLETTAEIFVSSFGLFSENKSSNNLAVLFQNGLICVEMVFAAVGHYIYFSYKEYTPPNSKTAGRMRLYYAFLDSFGLGDVIMDIKESWSGSQYTYGHFEPKIQINELDVPKPARIPSKTNKNKNFSGKNKQNKDTSSDNSDSFLEANDQQAPMGLNREAYGGSKTSVFLENQELINSDNGDILNGNYNTKLGDESSPGECSNRSSGVYNDGSFGLVQGKPKVSNFVSHKRLKAGMRYTKGGEQTYWIDKNSIVTGDSGKSAPLTGKQENRFSGTNLDYDFDRENRGNGMILGLFSREPQGLRSVDNEPNIHTYTHLPPFHASQGDTGELDFEAEALGEYHEFEREINNLYFEAKQVHSDINYPVLDLDGGIPPSYHFTEFGNSRGYGSIA